MGLADAMASAPDAFEMEGPSRSDPPARLRNWLQQTALADVGIRQAVAEAVAWREAVRRTTSIAVFFF